jgi:hypothetical protein
MASYADCLAALPAFRNEVLLPQMDEQETAGAFAARGAFSALASPAANIHATGVGIRKRAGTYVPEENVIKLYVFHKLGPGDPGAPEVRDFEGVPVDVEELPVQRIRGTGPGPAVFPQRQHIRPIVGGISTSPINANFVGTLGCFLRRRRLGTEQIFALSNNHVFADVNSLPIGTAIVQPGPEAPSFSTPPANVYARLSSFIPIQFPTSDSDPVANRFDAAIAIVTDDALIQRGAMFGGILYNPSRVATLVPGMRVTKCGRTTGVTRGIVTAIDVDGVLINYGTNQNPRLAVFNDTVEIVSTAGGAFSMPGDSGSVILEESTGHPVALLFAGDGVNTTACALGPLCRRLRAMPV